MPVVKCLKCKEDAYSDKEIVCDGCKQTIHAIKCAQLTRSEVACLTAKDRRIKYVCDACNTNLSMLKKRIDELNEKIVKLEQSNQNLITESIIYEINERRRRASNVIIFNAEESSSDNLNDKIEHDKKQCIEIIKHVADINLDEVKVIRLGKNADGKVRPLKVILRNEVDALSVLRNKKKLPRTSKVSIQSDRTPMQRDYFNKIKAELTSRQDKGENDITMKYIRGIPTITKLKN